MGGLDPTLDGPWGRSGEGWAKEGLITSLLHSLRQSDEGCGDLCSRNCLENLLARIGCKREIDLGDMMSFHQQGGIYM